MDSSPEDRQYYPIWQDLKANNTARITAPRALHRRIIKAVKKEKWMDIGYKISIEPRKAIISHARSGGVVTFFLTFSLTVDDF
jgi:hypothetical protein